MSLEIKVPAVGESINEVTISQWLKQDGDYVELDEIICELESDKATFELNAESAGVLKILVEEGETIDIGTLICTIEPAENGAATPEPTPAPVAAPAETASNGASSGQPTFIDMTVPTVGESINEVTIASWNKADRESVELEELLCEIESDKATFELMAEHSGILHIVAKEGATLNIGDLICKIEVTEGASAPVANTEVKQEATTSSSTTQQTSTATTYASGHPSPAASKILSEKGINPQEVKGTGVDGRITKEDAEKAQKAVKTPSASQAKSTPTQESVAPVGERSEVRKKMSSLRKTVARRLVSVKNETAMLTTFNEVNMKPIMDIRKKYKEMFKEKYEVGLGFMSFFTKACCVALQEFEAVNAQIDGDEIVYNNYCDISIAVSAPKGLVVPVIRSAELLDFKGVESEVIRLAKKARDNKLTIPEMTGGTFTITNGGVFGSMMSTPIINAPQSAILGMHNIVQRPMAVNGEVKILPMMYVALSYDHRIIDGRESVSFLVRVKELLEDPIRLLIGV